MSFRDFFLAGAHYSGLGAMFIAWLVVVAVPLYRLTISVQQETISRAMATQGEIMRLVNIGLIVGAFLQAWFWFYLVYRFQLQPSGFTSLTYASLCVATGLAAVYDPKSYPRVHLAVSVYYFLLSPFFLLLFSTELSNLNQMIYLTSIVCAVAYTVGAVVLITAFRNMRNTLLEVYSFGVLSVWMVVATFA